MSNGPRPRPQGGLELYAWLFMRISGVVLLFLALGHLAIMHLINNIEVVNLRPGTGGKPLCKDCADLNRAGK